jgi:FixJ family two-component response regulator
MTHDNSKEAVVSIVDDDEMFVRSTARLLQSMGYEARTYTDVGDFLMAAEPERTGCILLDVRLPGTSGLDLQTALQTRAYHSPIIFLTGYADVPSSVRAMKEGAVDYLTKPVAKETLLAAVENALKLDAERRAARMRLQALRECYQTLTERERQVFAGVVAGKLNKQIAVEMGAAVRTVKSHRAHVMQKMNTESLADLVRVSEQLRASNGQNPT